MPMLCNYNLCTDFSPKVEQIEKVFAASTKQKAWDHFSKAQRKNLDIWRKQCQVSVYGMLGEVQSLVNRGHQQVE